MMMNLIRLYLSCCCYLLLCLCSGNVSVSGFVATTSTSTRSSTCNHATTRTTAPTATTVVDLQQYNMHHHKKNEILEGELTASSSANKNKIVSTMLGVLIGITAATTVPATTVNAIVEPDAIIGTPLETPVIQMSDATYPVLSSLGDMTSLTTKLITLLDTKMSQTKLNDAIDKGIDTFLSIPDDKIDIFTKTLQTSVYNDNTCTNSVSIPLYNDVVKEFVSSSNIIKSLDSSKIQSLQTKYSKANQAVPTTKKSSSEKEDTTTTTLNVCLPNTKEQFQQLYIGQTQLVLNVPRPTSRTFVSSLSNALASAPSSEYLKLYPDIKKVFSASADKKVIMKFESTAKSYEKSLQGDVRVIQRIKITQ